MRASKNSSPLLGGNNEILVIANIRVTDETCFFSLHHEGRNTNEFVLVSNSREVGSGSVIEYTPPHLHPAG